jgi:hypothetical protein
MAEQASIKGRGVNRVILVSDKDFNQPSEYVRFTASVMGFARLLKQIYFKTESFLKQSHY